jgi:hypothetical protein
VKKPHKDAAMARHLPLLNAFEVAARHLSFTPAAAELHVGHRASSCQVRALRDYLRLPWGWQALWPIFFAGMGLMFMTWYAALAFEGGGLDPHEVTNAQYGRFIAATGHEPPPYWPNGAPPPERSGEPVVMVTWHDAVAYCVWDGQKKLPTVAEWQAACQAGQLHKLGYVWEWTASPAEEQGEAKILCGPRGTCACGHVYDAAWRNMVKGFRCTGSQPMAFHAPLP